MKPLRDSLLIFGVVAIAGCALRVQTPADVAHLRLDGGDSPMVRVTKIWLERNDGPLVARGYVVKRIDARDTTNTHLDVTLYDRDGQVLRRTVEYFEPRQIPRRPKMPDSVTFRFVVDPLPVGTARIAVRAHEGTH